MIYRHSSVALIRRVSPSHKPAKALSRPRKKREVLRLHTQVSSHRTAKIPLQVLHSYTLRPSRGKLKSPAPLAPLAVAVPLVPLAPPHSESNTFTSVEPLDGSHSAPHAMRPVRPEPPRSVVPLVPDAPATGTEWNRQCTGRV